MPAFPVYRKLPNLKSHYRILSASEFDEIQQVGTLYFRTTTNAVKYPEIRRLQDMISCSPPFETSSAEDFNSRLEKL